MRVTRVSQAGSSPSTVLDSDDILAEALGTDPKASEKARRAGLVRAASKRRRFVDPATCEREYSRAEVEFMNAIQAFKLKTGRNFPTWAEVLSVIRDLGYTKNTPPAASA